MEGVGVVAEGLNDPVATPASFRMTSPTPTPCPLPARVRGAESFGADRRKP
jgi:hypothetical protein